MEDSGEIKTDKKGVPATEEFTNETNHPKPSKRKFTLVAVTAIGLIGIAVGIVGIIIISMKNSETARLEQQIIEKDVTINKTRGIWRLKVDFTANEKTGILQKITQEPLENGQEE